MTDRFNWRLSIYAVVAAPILLLPLALYSADGVFLFLFVSIILSLSLLVIALVVLLRKKRLLSLSVMSMFAVYCAVSWASVKNFNEIRVTARWLISSRTYKAQLLAQPDSANGDLRHIEWDGWGFPGAGNTVMYLVFDPNDSLATAAKDHSAGKFGSIPCAVSRVRRLESHWYSVLFYTETDWNHCM
jgi:hypothetical protein